MKHSRVALGLLLVLAGVAVWSALRLTPRPGPVSPFQPLTGEAAAAGEPRPRFASETAVARSPEVLADAPAPAAVSAAPPGAELQPSPGDVVGRLVAELERLDVEHAATFHEDAARLLETFAMDTSADAEAVAEALVQELEARPHAVRVDGALLAALGGSGGRDEIMARIPGDAEVRRGAFAALAWGGADAPAEGALVLRPAEFLKWQPHGDLAVLDLKWSRFPLPESEVEVWVWSRARRLAEDRSALLDRGLAVLALGVGVDVLPGTREAFRDWLMDRDPATQQLRPALVFVLSKARSEEARQILNQFLDDEQAGEYGKTLGRYLLSKQAPSDGDVARLAAPFRDPASSQTDRVAAAGALMARIQGASPDDLAQIEEILARRLFDETDDFARGVAIVALLDVPGGYQRQFALDSALRSDASLVVRRRAAGGLARTQGPLRAESLSMLRASLSLQTDPGLKEYIVELLEKAESADQAGN